MTNRQRTFGLVALLIAIAAALASYRLAPGETPPGQRSLVTLDAASLDSLRADFDREATQARLIVLLSPT